MIQAIYARFGKIECIECDDLEEAKDFLECQSYSGEGYGLGVYDDKTKTFYVLDNNEVYGQTKDDVLAQKRESLKDQGIVPDKIESL